MKVDIGNGKKDILIIKEDDDPKELAYNFCIKNDLPISIANILAENILIHMVETISENQNEYEKIEVKNIDVKKIQNSNENFNDNSSFHKNLSEINNERGEKSLIFEKSTEKSFKINAQESSNNKITYKNDSKKDDLNSSFNYTIFSPNLYGLVKKKKLITCIYYFQNFILNISKIFFIEKDMSNSDLLKGMVSKPKHSFLKSGKL